MQRKLYIIATTSRSGSTHLCRMLTSTGRLGEPAEYYNPRSKPKRMLHWNASTGWEYFQQVLLHKSTPNGVCGLKVPTTAFDDMRRDLGGVFELLRPKYIWLRRRDLIRQAISLYRANETGIWHWHAGTDKPDACPPFDKAKIEASRRQIEQANDSWANWFGEHNIRPLEVWYEDVVAQPLETVQAICRHVGVDDARLPPIESNLRMMRDSTTDLWLSELRGAI